MQKHREKNVINRPECRTMSFRPRLTKMYCGLKAEKNKTWIIDLHSYFPKKDNNIDIVILDLENRDKIPANVNQLMRRLKENVSVKFYEGKLSNDILRESRDWGFMNSILIDINEKISGKMLKKTITTIVDVIKPIDDSCSIM